MDPFKASVRAAAREAAMEGGVNGLLWLLDQGFPVDGRVQGTATLLMVAARADQAEVVKALLSRGADKELKDGFGSSALRIAAEREAPAALRALLGAGADMESGSGPGRGRGTALVLAAGSGSDKCLALLLARGADIEARDGHGQTALMRSVEKSKAGCVVELLAAGADLDARDGEGRSALDLADLAGQEGLAQLLRAERARREGSQIARSAGVPSQASPGSSRPRL